METTWGIAAVWLALVASLLSIRFKMSVALAEILVGIAAKVVGVWPLARAFGFAPRESNYTTLLMSTGLTFGTISALFGLNKGYIDEYQYSILVTVVIASAVVPTMIAQAFFMPEIEPTVAFQTGSPATSNPPSGKPGDAPAPDPPPPKES